MKGGEYQNKESKENNRASQPALRPDKCQMKKVKKIYALYHYPPCKTVLKLAREYVHKKQDTALEPLSRSVCGR